MYAARNFRLLTATILVGVITFAATADIPKAEKEADWKALAKAAVRFPAEFESQSAFTKGGEKYVAEWNEWKKEFPALFDNFKKKYGATWEEVQPHFDGMSTPMGVAQGIDYVWRCAERVNIEAHEKQLADWAEKFAKSQYNNWQRMFDQNHENVEVMMRHADRSSRFMKLAAKMNPEGDYGSYIQAADEAVEKTLPKFKEFLKEKTWPAPNASYTGADKPEALAAAALEFLKEHPEWTAPEFDDKHVPVAAVVSGSEWKVYKAAPLTGEPLQYSIKMLVAFTGDKHPDLAYAYFMEFYTAEGKGVKPALPFKYANSRQYECYRMLRENLPE